MPPRDETDGDLLERRQRHRREHRHRLLKNHAREQVGSVPYAIVTDTDVRALGIPTDRMVEARRRTSRWPPVPVHVLALA